MKKALFIFLVLVFLPYAIFAVSNAKVNGQKEIVITQLPADIVFTCDLAQAGNKLAFEYFVDMDMDGKVSQLEEIIDFFYVTDGIGWIRDSENPDNDFAGDETAVDGKLKITTTIEQQEVLIPSGIFGLMKVTDEDGSSDMVKIKIQITPQPPFIQGKVTNAVNGNPIQNAFIVAEKQDESVFGVTDVNGDYVIAVTNGTYQVVAMEFPMQNFQMSDTASVTVANNQSVTKNFALQPFTSFVQGKLAKQDGAPVPGILILVSSGSASNPLLGMVVSDEQGNYKSGVKAGLVAVSPSSLYNFDNENWPTDFYVEPEVDSILVAEGQTVTSNFTFKPYSCFVIGKCSADNVALAGVEISGISFNMTTFTLLFYHTISAQNGYYRLGVMPGTLTSLTAYKDGYELTSPVGGYFQINVAQGETVSGKNFTFSPLSVVASIAGSVTFNDGSPATNVYVAAENLAVESPAGFLIAYTDGSGNFSIDNVQNGSYKLGVYRSGHASDPEMRYFPIMGAPVTGQDFVLSPGSGVDSHDKSVLPRKIKLAQNFPNPFNPSTTISFALPSASDVNITIFNASAQKIRTLVDRYCSAGQHQVVWDGRNEAGEKVASGLYLYQLKSNSYNKVMKMILAK